MKRSNPHGDKAGCIHRRDELKLVLLYVEVVDQS